MTPFVEVLLCVLAAVVTLLAIVCATVHYFFLLFTDSPTYLTTRRIKGLEIREYPQFLLAEVRLSGSYAACFLRGKGILDKFFAGENTQVTDNKDLFKWAATPSDPQELRLVRTSPVFTRKVDAADHTWLVSYVLPSKYADMKNVPVPRNPAIHIKNCRNQQVVSSSFSGPLPTDSDIARKKMEFLKVLQAEGLWQAGAVVTFAQYHPTWVPAFLRRQELHALLPDGDVL